MFHLALFKQLNRLIIDNGLIHVSVMPYSPSKFNISDCHMMLESTRERADLVSSSSNPNIAS